jgi:tetratricopeptide (TPR) repeat protein
LASSGAIENLAGSLLTDLKQSRQRPEALQPLLNRLASIGDSTDGTTSTIAMLQNLNSNERSQLLGAFEALEQSLGHALGDELGEELLNKAESELAKLLTSQPEHAFAHAMRASCLYNQAKIHEGRGKLDEAKALIQRSNDALKDAYRLRNQIIDRLARLEVEADYALMVAKDYPGAIMAYEQIVSFSEASPIQSALRAHWMLAGIFNGAWDIAKNDATVANPDKAKHHIVQILAFWPESVEATAIKRYLLWDEQKNKSRTPYLPIEGDLLTSNE